VERRWREAFKSDNSHRSEHGIRRSVGGAKEVTPFRNLIVTVFVGRDLFKGVKLLSTEDYGIRSDGELTVL
jgi:hypothetical protein